MDEITYSLVTIFEVASKKMIMIIRSLFNRALRSTLRLVPSWLMPLDLLLRGAMRVTSAISRGIFVLDWRVEVRGRPQFFKHQIDICCWPFEPSLWSFAARGVYARENMFRGCKVLDLCCGDGSYSYLFFSDIAGAIDAVDNDSSAVAYARSYFSSPVINHHRLDIVSQYFPAKEYDFIVWNAAICYFKKVDIENIVRKCLSAGKTSFELSGMLPKANQHTDHKTEFNDVSEVKCLFASYFDVVNVKEIDEGNSTTFYFKCRSPVSQAKLTPTY